MARNAKRSPSAPASPNKVTDTGVTVLKFETSDGYVYVWMGPTEAWKAGPGAKADEDDSGWSEWASLHPDLDLGRIVAVRCEPKPDARERSESGKGWINASGMAVRKMRRLRAAVLDALEASDDVRSVYITAGGDGRAEFQVGMDPDPEDKLPGRMNAMDPSLYVRLTFFDDECEAW